MRVTKILLETICVTILGLSNLYRLFIVTSCVNIKHIFLNDIETYF